MNDYEDNEYLSVPQRLGEEGITMSCVEAMAVILTSQFKPKRITLVSYPETVAPGQKGFDHVMFVAWGWLNSAAFTIVPDGFGTHGGEGGMGLKSVLGLIRYFQTPLYHAVIFDKAMFRNLAGGGEINDSLFNLFKEARPYNWSYYPPYEVKKVKKRQGIFLEVDYWKFRVYE